MLQPCPECHNEVSDSAATCPQCGYQLLGREHLVTCPGCKAEVVPEVNPRDTISLYCPICKKPITGLRGRKIFFVMLSVFAFGFLAALASLFYFIACWSSAITKP